MKRRALITGALAAPLLPTRGLAATSSALDRAVASPARSPKFVARDGARHPAAELAFFGVTPRSNVIEIWPGGGYWTQILAPLLHDQGTYAIAVAPPGGQGNEAAYVIGPKLRAILDADPAIYGRVHVTEFGAGPSVLAPPDSVDIILTFRNLHNWMKDGNTPELLAKIQRALKPGGILGVEDHRGRPDAPQDPRALDGYVRQDYARALIERAGFALVASSELDANPRDTTHWPKGVWTLPPTLAEGPVDRAKYQAIGEADNFVLKFRKS